MSEAVLVLTALGIQMLLVIMFLLLGFDILSGSDKYVLTVMALRSVFETLVWTAVLYKISTMWEASYTHLCGSHHSPGGTFLTHTHARVCMYVYVGFSWGLSNDMIFIQEILFKRCAQYKHHRYKLERKVITKGLETTYSVTKSVLNLVPALC